MGDTQRSCKGFGADERVRPDFSLLTFMKNLSPIFRIFLILILVPVLGLFMYRFKTTERIGDYNENNSVGSHDGMYLIDGREITLVNGVSEIKAEEPGFVSTIMTRYFGNEVAY